MNRVILRIFVFAITLSFTTGIGAFAKERCGKDTCNWESWWKTREEDQAEKDTEKSGKSIKKQKRSQEMDQSRAGHQKQMKERNRSKENTGKTGSKK